jgi:hypothetical protein
MFAKEVPSAVAAGAVAVPVVSSAVHHQAGNAG